MKEPKLWNTENHAVFYPGQTFAGDGDGAKFSAKNPEFWQQAPAGASASKQGISEFARFLGIPQAQQRQIRWK